MSGQATAGFELLDHPADLGFNAWASDLPDLFCQCARALTSVLVDVESLVPAESVNVHVEGDDVETLLYNWLAEILYLFDGEKKLFCRYSILSLESQPGSLSLKAELRGQQFDPRQQQIRTYVKAVTFHQLAVKPANGGYRARVFLDI